MNLKAENFTKDSGFERGVLIEVFDGDRWFCGYFNCDHNNRLVFDTELDENRSAHSIANALAIPLENIKAIRILTGSHRFWSGAPEWAGFCVVHRKNGHVYYYTGQAEVDILLIEEGETGVYDVTSRPWWCDFGKEG